MNCQRHYDLLILRARGRVIAGYSEKHHVLPRCMGGGNSAVNIVRLTPEEHFVAHQLLVKIHPGVRGLIFACHAMMMDGRRRTRSANKEFGWLRRLNAKALGERRLGAKHSDEVRSEMSRVRLGRPQSSEHRAAIAAANKGKSKSADHIAKVSAALKGKPGTRLGMTTSEETKAKQREATLRRYHPDGVIPIKSPADPVVSARAHKAWTTKRARTAA